MVNNMTKELNVVPIFKTFDELQDDETAITVDVVREWNEANDAFDAAMAKVAALKKNPPGDISAGYTRAVEGLKKLALLDPANASICYLIIQDLAAFEKKRIVLEGEHAIELAEKSALAQLLDARKAVVEKRDERVFGFGKLARRSQRFATTHMHRTGPGAR
jgi:hypothetical protein